MGDESFGTQLRAARKRAGFHTIAAFVDALTEVRLLYSEDAIGSWETNRRRPYRSEIDRVTVLRIFQVLANHGGFDNAAQVDKLLAALDRPLLNSQEKDQYFPGLTVPILNLPEKPPYERLVGRDEALDTIIDVLQSPAGKQVIVISGLGGIGKTALAYESVRRVMASGRYEKLAWETAKSEEFTGTSIRVRRPQAINFATVLAGYARQLGFDALASQPPQVLRFRLQNNLRQGNYLLVLDNLETLEAAQEAARELYEMVSPGRSRVLITSRARMADEAFVSEYFVRGLLEPDSLELLHDEAATRGADAILRADVALLKQIHTTVGGMPLALKLIVSQSLLGIAIDEELERLKGVVEEQELYRFIYFAIWQKLSYAAQKLLIGAATFATSALRSMLQPVSELDEAAFNRAVPELVRASLMETSYHALAAQKRYDIHAMTRWFVNGPLTDLWNQQKGQSPSP
jgi:hypothetical protein